MNPIPYFIPQVLHKQVGIHTTTRELMRPGLQWFLSTICIFWILHFYSILPTFPYRLSCFFFRISLRTCFCFPSCSSSALETFYFFHTNTISHQLFQAQRILLFRSWWFWTPIVSFHIIRAAASSEQMKSKPTLHSASHSTPTSYCYSLQLVPRSLSRQQGWRSDYCCY